MELKIRVKDHPILTQEQCQYFIDCGMPLHEVMTRGTGRSTAIAFETIAKAIGNPGEWIPAKDHHGTIDADRHLCYAIRDICERLELKNFTFRSDAIKFG